MLSLFKSARRPLAQIETRAPRGTVEIVPMSYVDRGHVITAAAIAEMEEAASWHRAGWIMVAVVACGAAFAAGASLPRDTGARAAASYELVIYTGPDSDVVDYDLTYDDCAGFLAQRQALGARASCQSAK